MNRNAEKTQLSPPIMFVVQETSTEEPVSGNGTIEKVIHSVSLSQGVRESWSNAFSKSESLLS